ncbi:MAG: lysylphosphatidylglycerol synthase transmembrane domain-containing protein [Flavobacteriaceae bacterium]|nr:lysylphosphatidylglycerol synthase transmembrane domain-containing protein [Flavobacteriaceae bacterium]MDG2314347.1 lysylphosphatidylglycerol synthase transmembrane domain-containing protein [Flavobacteriaceae bacterium]
MNKKAWGFLKFIAPLLLGAFFIAYSFSNTTVEDRKNILQAIQSADYRFVGLSVLIGIASHLSRAYRWKLMLLPVGHNISFINSILLVLITYLSNLGIPRSGEFLRATALRTYEKVPFEKGFGTIVTERVIDVLFLVAFLLIGGMLNTELLTSYSPNSSAIVLVLFLAAIAIAGFVVIRKKGFASSNKWIQKIGAFFKGLAEGILSVDKIPNKQVFIIHSILIWVFYLLMFDVIKYSIPETADLSLSQTLLAFIAGAVAMSTTNGGIGVFPIAVSAVLMNFGVPLEAALAFGWLMWTSQTLMVVVFGSISFLLLPVVNRNN